ncbi:MAG: phage tail protein [Alphaproteobacteria bacterium]|nr:phage tail protein [Alphaproteobacteria bacterium]
MAQPYVGEIRLFAGNFAPAGWMFCDGQLLPISENDTLFQLLGTTYGGDGQETFALPNLQSRIPVHMGTHAGRTFQLAEASGIEQVTLTTNQIPIHTHPMLASGDAGSQPNPGGAVLGALSTVSIYKPNAVAPAIPLNTQAITVIGGSQPHDNMQPFLCINFILSLFGIFPSPT